MKYFESHSLIGFNTFRRNIDTQKIIFSSELWENCKLQKLFFGKLTITNRFENKIKKKDILELNSSSKKNTYLDLRRG